MKSIFMMSAAVTQTSPSFHNPGHLRMWFDSPLRQFNPHILLIILGVIIIGGGLFFIYFRQKDQNRQISLTEDKEEKIFQQLLGKRDAIMTKMIDLEDELKAGKISEDKFHEQFNAYKELLIQVKFNIKQMTE
ncbi:hypothetical protein [Bacillus sp. SM2101]|uniref:hypothetical protein n=1 Tax=Bacillus sp. SM2101 TaxID=2805366 RepID=UPI001BDF2998|nr:hypothetical protein [Bacillus sp. SM2101]